ncbi:MAG: ATP-dependent helicase, partial [Bifidobacteriaceae bacterium]|nr:ATP-dependent helicase [Bifidobacteriaceae bacterium]
MTQSQPRVEVTGRRQAPAEPALCAEQRAALEQIEAGGPVAVAGAPGTGKTVLAVAAVARLAALERGSSPAGQQSVLLLAPTRRAASALKIRVDAAIGATTTGASTMTAMALAYAIGRRAAVARGEPPPIVVTGAEQDAIIADLLAGHAEGIGAPVRWPDSVPPATRSLRAFRHELRDLMMRAAERQIGPVELDDLGQRHGVAEWRATAQLYQEYLDVQALRGSVAQSGARYDVAALVSSATQVLRDQPDWTPPWRRIVVDDYQEASSATRDLLHQLAERGAQVVVLGCPDICVQTYRGARPELLAQATDRPPVGLGAELVRLTVNWRQVDRLRQATAGIVRHIRPGRLAMAARETVPPPPEPPGAPSCADDAGTSAVAVALPSAAEEAAYIAHALRSAHLLGGMPWSAMAVLTRSSAAVGRLRLALEAARVPVDVPGMEVPIQTESAVRPLLRLLSIVSGEGELTPADAHGLLASPIGGMDAMSLRKLRRALRAQQLDRPVDELMVGVLQDPAAILDLPGPLRRPVARLAAVLAAGAEAAAEPGTDAELVLWALWEATGLAPTWQAIAVSGGAGAARADRDLDAVGALMDAAGRYAERRPGASPASFAEALESQEVPADTLAPNVIGERITLATAAAAIGREWDLVVVAGLQEGVWPDLRLRNTLLGAGRLADLVDGRGESLDLAEQRRSVLDDELRSFALACSRSRRRLILTSVASDEERPSEFFGLTGVDVERDGQGRPVVTRAPLPVDLRGLVAELRAKAIQSDGDSTRLLAALAERGVAGAAPDSWSGLLPVSSTDPLYLPGTKVVLTPSRVETLAACPLRWALDGVGGHGPPQPGQVLGTILHSIAETTRSADVAVLQAAFDDQWRELEFEDTWLNRREYQRGQAMVAQLAVYNAAHSEPITVEAPFEIEVEGVTVRGKIDRIEPATSGAPLGGPEAGVPGAGDEEEPESPRGETGAIPVRVVDFKTGRQVVSVAEAANNPQLGVYQLAINLGGLDKEVGAPLRSQGAGLVYLAKTSSSGPTIRGQQPVGDGEEWVRPMLADCGAAAVGPSYVAV